MKAEQLITLLSKFPGDTEVMLLDSHNGGGYPRTINFGPLKHRVNKADVDNCADCEGKHGQQVVIMGYGCY